jgi:hypothetical protein
MFVHDDDQVEEARRTFTDKGNPVPIGSVSFQLDQQGDGGKLERRWEEWEV